MHDPGEHTRRALLGSSGGDKRRSTRGRYRKDKKSKQTTGCGLKEEETSQPELRLTGQTGCDGERTEGLRLQRPPAAALSSACDAL